MRFFPGSSLLVNWNVVLGADQGWELVKQSIDRRSCFSSERAMLAEWGTTSTYFRWLAEGKCDHSLEETLGFDASHFVNLHRRTFVLTSMDNFKRSLTWLFFWSTLQVLDKFARHDVGVSATCPLCRQSSETVLLASVQCPSFSDLWFFYWTGFVTAGESID